MKNVAFYMLLFYNSFLSAGDFTDQSSLRTYEQEKVRSSWLKLLEDHNEDRFFKYRLPAIDLDPKYHYAQFPHCVIKIVYGFADNNDKILLAQTCNTLNEYQREKFCTMQ